MGAWSFVDRRIEQVLGRIGHKAGRPIYVGRAAAASPATGLARTHASEQAALVHEALGIDVAPALRDDPKAVAGLQKKPAPGLDTKAGLGVDVRVQ